MCHCPLFGACHNSGLDVSGPYGIAPVELPHLLPVATISCMDHFHFTLPLALVFFWWCALLVGFVLPLPLWLRVAPWGVHSCLVLVPGHLACVLGTRSCGLAKHTTHSAVQLVKVQPFVSKQRQRSPELLAHKWLHLMCTLCWVGGWFLLGLCAHAF